jgi:cytochrome c-type biogenesis protein CcmF
VSRFFDGEATSEVGLDAGPFKDVWTVVNPSLDGLLPIIEQGDEALGAPSITPELRDAALAQSLVGLTKKYAEDPPPATFRLLVSPMVTWIWIGALIVFCGGLIALWPAPRRAPRPVAARYAARVAQELGRA